MQFNCRFSYFPQPYDPEYFIREYEIDVISGNEQGEFLAGRLALDFLDIDRIELSGESVFEVCDADSSGWVNVYRGLFDEHDGSVELRKDFEFDDPIHYIVYLHRVVLGPSMRDWRKFIVAHVANMFSHDTATVMRKDQEEFSKTELTELGFWSIGGSNLLFRPNTHQHPYDPNADQRDALSADACQFDEEFVNKYWQKRS